MRAHSHILHIYTGFTNMVYTQFNKCIKVFRSDGAHEYISSSMQIFSNRMVLSLSNLVHIVMNKMVF